MRGGGGEISDGNAWPLRLSLSFLSAENGGVWAGDEQSTGRIDR